MIQENLVGRKAAADVESNKIRPIVFCGERDINILNHNQIPALLCLFVKFRFIVPLLVFPVVFVMQGRRNRGKGAYALPALSIGWGD